ncbi:MAG TPA: ATP-binding protein [Thermoanaerobaculia bacterium]
MKRRTILSWSSGKDSAWSLQVLRSDPRYEVVALLTTITRQFDRVAMHGVRRELLEAQAAAAALPLWKLEIPTPCSNEDYDAVMRAAVVRAVAEQIECIAFGDLFLEDIRRYREDRLAGSGLEPVFPLWQKPTDALAREMIEGGLRARISCVDPRALTADFAGREFDAVLLRDLPAAVDPCGERGEFHTFAYAGPMFEHAIAIETGETVERDGFVFTDLLAATAPQVRTARAADSSSPAS